MSSFWISLPRPFTVLAPMEGVTDNVFREIICEIGRPDVFFTEFVSVEGLNSLGFEKVSASLSFKPNQKPIVAQLWGKTPDDFKKATKLCRKMGFSGVDINMGCPDRVIIKRGSCAALIKNPDLAETIIETTKKAAGDDLAVSVKTRLGFEDINLEWIKYLLKQDLDALTIHLRTVLELSNSPAHWEVMREIIKLRDEYSPKTMIIGNGDILTQEEVREKHNLYKVDGVMIGRGVFKNPWIFNNKVDINKITVETRINLYLQHIELFSKTWPNSNFAVLKKFCKTYINNLNDSARLRDMIMESKNILEMKEILNNYKNNFDILRNN